MPNRFSNALISALRAAAIPLVLAYVLSAVTSIGEARQTGKLASLCLLSFAGLILLAATYSLPLGYLLSSNFSVDPETLTTLQELVSSVAFEGPAQGGGPPSLGESISRLIPSNLFRAALEDQLLALILAALVFGMAVTRLDTQGREVLTQLFQAFARAMMTVVIWILTVMPLGVFSLAFVMARQAGWTAAWTFGYWVLGASALFLGFNLLLYPIASGLGRVPVAWFARRSGATGGNRISVLTGLYPSLDRGGRRAPPNAKRANGVRDPPFLRQLQAERHLGESLPAPHPRNALWSGT